MIGRCYGGLHGNSLGEGKIDDTGSLAAPGSWGLGPWSTSGVGKTFLQRANSKYLEL